MSATLDLRLQFRAPRPPREAAGLLLKHTDDDGAVWFLLGLRAARVSNGGTWANIGGSCEHGERALDAAVREFTEEVGLPATALRGATVERVVESRDHRVHYTLYVLDVPHAFDNADPNDEHDDLAWFRSDGISDLDLHPGFAKQWAAIA